MGSVGDDYRCPLCGRVGNGGYHADGGPNYPVCTGGDYACLWRLAEDHTLTPLKMMLDQLNAIFHPAPSWAVVMPYIANFLFRP